MSVMEYQLVAQGCMESVTMNEVNKLASKGWRIKAANWERQDHFWVIMEREVLPYRSTTQQQDSTGQS